MRREYSAIPNHSLLRRGSLRNVLAVIWGTVCGVMALWSYLEPPKTSRARDTANKPTVTIKTAKPRQMVVQREPRFVAKRIRDIEPIADRVIAKNSEDNLHQGTEDSNEELAELTDEEIAELEVELKEFLGDEPLPALIDGLKDDSHLAAVNDEDRGKKADLRRVERLYAALIASAEALAAQPNAVAPEQTDYGPFVREHWRILRFLLTRPDGDEVRITLARPTWWMEAEQVQAGGQYEFDMEEVGAVGTAEVLPIAECPEPPRRQNEHHRLVTGKFEHQATNIIDLFVESQEEPIGTTANHPFWSEDRQAFVEAAALKPGENLLNAEGQRVQVITHAPRPGPQTVFNLEVDEEHVYRVRSDGLLVHNAYEWHHALPRFLGGFTKQVLTKLTATVHRAFHKQLRAELKKQGFRLPVGGKGGAAKDWFAHFAANEGSQARALQAVIDASIKIDKKFGTKILGDVLKNLIGKNYAKFL